MRGGLRSESALPAEHEQQGKNTALTAALLSAEGIGASTAFEDATGTLFALE
jgi:hypothetical protein